jgi:thiamine biosynthesis protein ThiS
LEPRLHVCTYINVQDVQDLMKVRVRVWGRDETELELPEKSTVEELLERLGIERETVVVKINDKISPESERLSDGDEVLIIPIVTGG